ncbi:MAG: GNAT family N-acetyltransferase [Candidatus Limivivens sp.]|nr:GNAT family N-acetyltransferase [Candidatus Limivivens sp.]
MKAVIRRMRNESAAAGLWEKLSQEGWTFLEDYDSFQESEAGKSPCLVVTDSIEGAEYAKKRNLACLACEPRENPFHFYGVDMIAEDLNELNGEFLKLVWQRHRGIPWTIAVTRRLILRESVMEDLEDFYSVYSGEGVTDYIPGLSADRQEEKRELECYIKNMYRFYNYGLWTVLERSSGRVVGRVGLENSANPQTGEAVLELGYLIGKPWQNQGYGTEAAEAAAWYAFEVAEVPELFIFIRKENLASRKVADHLDASFPGKIRVVLV